MPDPSSRATSVCDASLQPQLLAKDGGKHIASSSINPTGQILISIASTNKILNHEPMNEPSSFVTVFFGFNGRNHFLEHRSVWHTLAIHQGHISISLCTCINQKSRNRLSDQELQGNSQSGVLCWQKEKNAKSNGKAPSLAVDASDILRFGKISTLKQLHR